MTILRKSASNTNRIKLGQEGSIFNKYAYNTYKGFYYIPCVRCRGLTFQKNLIDGVCPFCILMTVPFELRIILRSSSSKKFKKVAALFNSISGANGDENLELVFDQVEYLCEYIENVKKIVLLAGSWKTFLIILNGRSLSSSNFWDLVNHLKRILEVENCRSFSITNDNRMVLIPVESEYSKENLIPILESLFWEMNDIDKYVDGYMLSQSYLESIVSCQDYLGGTDEEIRVSMTEILSVFHAPIQIFSGQEIVDVIILGLNNKHDAARAICKTAALRYKESLHR